MAANAPVTLRPVREDDLEFLYKLYARSRYDFQYVDWSSEAERQRITRTQFNAQHAHYTNHYPNSEHKVILRTDRSEEPRIGRIWTAYQEDHILVLDLNLLPEHRNEGIGTSLIKQKQAEAKADGNPLRHHVEINNTAALRLYRRLDFEIVDNQGTHYLMEWQAPTLTP